MQIGMNVKDSLKKMLWLVGVLMMPALLGSGCGSNSTPDPAAAAQNEEIQRLRQENQSLAEVRVQHEEVERLKQENQSLPKVRNEYQQATRLKKENDQLREQIAKISPAAAAGGATNASLVPHGVSALATASAAGTDSIKEAAEREATLNDGDEILVEPRALKAILPDMDWDKIERKEPLSVRTLLEKDGIQLTNVQQIRDLGITNFTIQRFQPPANSQGQAAPTK
jgi:hypothetical protein